jgi:hypothetical protein
MVIAAWFVQYQFSVMQNEISSLQAENSDLQDKNRNLSESSALKNQSGELMQSDLTKRLALAGDLRVEITALSPEDYWRNAGSFLGVLRARNVFNVTVRNNDVGAVSGLQLTVETLSGNHSVGWVFENQIYLLRVGEERVIVGQSITPINSLNDLSFVATLKLGDALVDEFRLTLNEIFIK